MTDSEQDMLSWGLNQLHGEEAELYDELFDIVYNNSLEELQDHFDPICMSELRFKEPLVWKKLTEEYPALKWLGELTENQTKGKMIADYLCKYGFPEQIFRHMIPIRDKYDIEHVVSMRDSMRDLEARANMLAQKFNDYESLKRVSLTYGQVVRALWFWIELNEHLYYDDDTSQYFKVIKKEAISYFDREIGAYCQELKQDFVNTDNKTCLQTYESLTDLKIPSWFNEYIKFLRRSGIPFDAQEGSGTGVFLKYNYFQVMELAIALLFRWHGISNKDLPKLLIAIRAKLHKAFLVAWIERETGLGKSLQVQTGPIAGEVALEGVYLDLCLKYFEGELKYLHNTKTGELLVMGPGELIASLSDPGLRRRNFSPIIHLSLMARQLIEIAKKIPEIKRGPKQ